MTNERFDKPTVFVLSGPNLNLLGTREPEIYGHDTLNDIHARLEAQAAELGIRVECRQTNHEGVLIDWLHEAYVAGAKAVLLNAGGYTHTSIAIHDAIKSIKVPVIEVHLSDPMTREEFRHISYVGMAAAAHFAGHGADSYTLALDAAARSDKRAHQNRGQRRRHTSAIAAGKFSWVTIKTMASISIRLMCARLPSCSTSPA